MMAGIDGAGRWVGRELVSTCDVHFGAPLASHTRSVRKLTFPPMQPMVLHPSSHTLQPASAQSQESNPVVLEGGVGSGFIVSVTRREQWTSRPVTASMWPQSTLDIQLTAPLEQDNVLQPSCQTAQLGSRAQSSGDTDE